MELTKPLSDSIININRNPLEFGFETSLLELIALMNAIELKLGLSLSIFLEVEAKLSPMALELIPEDPSRFFNRISDDLNFHDNGSFISGSLTSIVSAYAQLLKLFSDKSRITSPKENINKSVNVSAKSEALAKRRSKRLNAGLKYKAMKESVEERNDSLEERLDSDLEREEDEELVQSDYRTQFKHFCKLCSFKTKRISHLQKHAAIHKKVKTLFRCQLCSFTTVRLGHLRRHKMLHSNNIYKCEKCSYQTDEAKLLSRHVKLKHDSKLFQASQTNQMLECDQCSYKCSTRHLLERHLRVHGLRSHQCDLCRYRTRRKEHFVRHVNNVHNNKRPFLCHLCGKAFKRGDALRQHQITHEEDEGGGGGGAGGAPPPYPCEQCGKGFRSHSHFLEHTAVHSNDRAFLCEICGASFKTRSVQRKHVQTIHKNPRAFCCPACDRRFNTHYALKRHCKVHETPTDSVPITSSERVNDEKCSAQLTLDTRGQTDQDDPLTLNTPGPETVRGRSSLIRGGEVTAALLYLTNSL